MEKRKAKSLNAIYRNPLPIPLAQEKFGALPPLILHNPVSCVYFLYRLMRIYLSVSPAAEEVPIAVEMALSGDEPVFYVNDAADMDRCWRQGFFGKGTLSRSEPLWKQRVLRRLNLAGRQDEATMEEVTNVRREERKKYKELRSKFQKYETLLRQRELSPLEVEEWDNVRLQMLEAKETKSVLADNLEEQRTTDWREEDLAIIDPTTMELRQQLEVLMLQKAEVFFLAFALDVVKVTHNHNVLSLKQTFEACTGDNVVPQNKFILDYVVYHHFRSLGWCVRSGIKFGCDFLLYKRGPPFMHAEYTVLVIPSDQESWKAWEDIMAVSRVVSGVKKILILVYVDVPATEVFDSVYRDMDRGKFMELLSLYRVTEVVWRRWNPSRTRD